MISSASPNPGCSQTYIVGRSPLPPRPHFPTPERPEYLAIHAALQKVLQSAAAAEDLDLDLSPGAADPSAALSRVRAHMEQRLQMKPGRPPPAPDVVRAACIRDGGLTNTKDPRRREWRTREYRYSLQDAMMGPMQYLEEACWNSTMAIKRLMAGEGDGGGAGGQQGALAEEAAGKAVRVGQAVRHRHPLYKLRSMERKMLALHVQPERLFAAFGVDYSAVKDETCR